MMQRMLISAWMASLVFSAAQAQTTANNPVAEIMKVPIASGAALGGATEMVTHVFKPTDKGPGPYPVLVFSHGRAGTPVERAQLKHPVAFGHVRYWNNKGYAVVAAVRPGYGDTGGADREGSGARYDANGQCQSQPDHANTASVASSGVKAVVEWVRQQPWAKADRILIEGQSVGGLATVAACAQNLPGVIGCINFAGGAGGNPSLAPGRMCAPANMTTLMAELGKTVRAPSIWFYADNDLYWGAEPPKQWHAAYSQAAQANGGPAVEAVFTPPLPDADGHRLLLVGGPLWSQPLNAWLRKHGF
jgi:dienelactone hydrolase